MGDEGWNMLLIGRAVVTSFLSGPEDFEVFGSF